MRLWLVPKVKRGMESRYGAIQGQHESADAVRAAAHADVAEYESALAGVRAEAAARIDAALAADEITAAEAETLKDALADGSFPSQRLATAAGVAKQLDTTVAKLDAAYGSAQKAQAKARVDKALAAGNITEKYATELKASIDAATFPGFAAGGMGRHGGPGGHGGFGFGFGPPPGLDVPADGSSSSTAPAALALA